MFPESVFLTPLNGTIVTKNPTTYPWYSQLNLIPDGIDWDLPIRLKEKIYGIGSGKHPSIIINTLQEPVEFTLDMMMQDARFLALVTGTSSTAADGNSDQDLDITCIGAGTEGALATGDYFLIYTIDGSGHQICNAVWFDVNSGGGAPSITGATNIEVDVGTNDTAAQVATALHTKLEAETNYSASTGGSGIASITVHGPDDTHHGAVCDARDGASATAFTFKIITNGSSTHTVTESTDTTLKSFGLHIEQTNNTAGENIIVDLFGCIVISHEINIDYDGKVITESVTIRAMTYAIGDACTCVPPAYKIDPNTWADVVEAASNYLIMLDTDDKTPAIVSSIKLTIENEVDDFGDIGTVYVKFPISGKRIVTLNIIGFIQINDIWTYWYDTWDSANDYYTNAGKRLNSEIKIQRTPSVDLWQLSVYNWFIESYNLKLFSIDDKIMGIDATFTDATPDSNGRIIDSLSISDYVPKIYYGEANS